MAVAQSKQRLGRGLAALIGDKIPEQTVIEEARAFRLVPIEFIKANPNNPRKTFKESELQELAESIRTKGLLQPIVVRMIGADPNAFEIVAGERRWRAAQKAALDDIPVMVHDLSDSEALEIAIIENVQRENLNPIEEAEGYQRLIDQFQYKQNDLAVVVGKSRSHIANTLRLTKLPEKVQEYLRNGELTAGHARALLTSNEPFKMAEQIISMGLSVRDAEALGQKSPKSKIIKPRISKKDVDTISLERNLSQTLGLMVEIDNKGRAGGSVKIKYRTLEQLDDICTRLLRIK